MGLFSSIGSMFGGGGGGGSLFSGGGVAGGYNLADHAKAALQLGAEQDLQDAPMGESPEDRRKRLQNLLALHQQQQQQQQMQQMMPQQAQQGGGGSLFNSINPPMPGY